MIKNRFALTIIMLGSIATLAFGSLTYAESPLPSAYSSEQVSPPISADASSQQIPVGTKLKIRFISLLDSSLSNAGDVFLAQASEDLWIENQLILPKGTILRGRVNSVERPGFFSKGGLLRLDFEHVLMPSGEIMPLSLQIDAASVKMNMARQGFYTDPGMGAKLNSSVDKGVSQFREFHDKGIKAGQQRGGGANMLLTVPTNTIAGVVTGTAVTTGNAAKAIFGKGENVTLQPGEEIIIDFYRASTLKAQ